MGRMVRGSAGRDLSKHAAAETGPRLGADGRHEIRKGISPDVPCVVREEMLQFIGMSPAQAFQVAIEHHQAGRLGEAEGIYRQILAVQPQHADALHLLGVIAHQVGRDDVAVEIILTAIALVPTTAMFHSNLGEVYRKLGRQEDAIIAYRRAVELQPDFAEAHNNLGNALREKGRPDEAIASCRRALELRPGHPESHNNLGNALHDQGRIDEAIAAYRTAIHLKPDFALAWYNLGNVLNGSGQIDGAIAAFRAAIHNKPDYAEAHNDLGNALRVQGLIEQAIASYRTAIRFKPDSPDWQYVLDGLTGKTSASTAPATYVRGLFDEYAARFDEHLVGKLNYRVPEQLLDAVLAVAPARQFDILDLGCGTGLCGVKFRPHARTMVGVDLAPKMIEKAAARAIYDRLIVSDVVESMRNQADSFDLILAGDVYMYVGDLTATFAAAASTLRNGGLFAFSVERHDGEGFVLHTKVRFAHSLSYVREISRRFGLAEVRADHVVLRKEETDDAQGWIVVLRKTAITSAKEVTDQ